MGETPAHQYITVITSSPLIIVRVPWKRPKRSEFGWAITKVMRSYGLKQRDVSALDALLAGPAQWNSDYWARHDADLLPKLEAAFGGDADKFRAFDLYDWRGSEFVLVRKGKG
jgi:hypothetical protein